MSVLAKRLLAIDAALTAADIPHAFGGAIALAYCTEEPRGTRDLDINVFVGPERAGEVFGLLPDGVAATEADVQAAQRDGQVRLWWDDTPLDVFFDVHEFHHHVAAGVRWVAFEDSHIPVLGCDALVVFKALFNRTRDWADIEAVVEAGAIDGDDALRSVADLAGPDDPVTIRLAGLLQ